MDKESFNRYIENKVLKTVQDYILIEPGDKVAVALSGGKDSILTLNLLYQFQKEIDFEIFAITVDEGISGYREIGVNVAVEYAKELGIKLILKSFKQEFGFTLDDISSKYKSACIPCGVFRRHILNKTAYKEGAVKIATGHNLDDEIQSFIMSFARADLIKFYKFGPKLDTIHPRMIPRIKPLWNLPEKDVGMWAVLNNLGVHFADCPYSALSLRSKIKNFLNQLESENPGIKSAILESFKKSLQLKKSDVHLLECEICGEPSSSTTCKACLMVEEIKKGSV
ncbi:MAG: TIGR00269 family protein [Methanobacteriaceae archaeon]|nr:TIGR00269 family protein [Methanobacteriaceae archaeon]